MTRNKKKCPTFIGIEFNHQLKKMGCFSCFGISNHHQNPKKSTTPHPSQLKCEIPNRESGEETRNLELVEPILHSGGNDDQRDNCCDRKKVSSILDVETFLEVSIPEVVDLPTDSATIEAKTCSLGFENEKAGVKEVGEDKRYQSPTFSDSSNSSYISYPLTHKYSNCGRSEKEFEEADDHMLVQQESSGSLFSLSIESRKRADRIEVDDKEVNSPLNTHIHRSSKGEMELHDSVLTPISRLSKGEMELQDSVLNPIENLSQWKELKRDSITNPKTMKDQEKENVNLEEREPNDATPLTLKKLDQKSKQNTHTMRKDDNDIAVDTSLSSWLVESGKESLKSPRSTGSSCSDGVANSWKRFEDRPIIGTVGSYWIHTGQATDSSNSGPIRMSGRSRKFKEDMMITSCHSTPLAQRLEGAVDKDTT